MNPQSLDFQGFRQKSRLLFFYFMCYNVRAAKKQIMLFARGEDWFMADITLHRDSEIQRTVVPNYFIDAYIIAYYMLFINAIFEDKLTILKAYLFC